MKQLLLNVIELFSSMHPEKVITSITYNSDSNGKIWIINDIYRIEISSIFDEEGI